ncbi:MAG: hypothetical protein ACK5MA_07230 [Parachlamydiaceae bacterium]
MNSIKNACNNYFHLIRHPDEAERKRDKLLTAAAILSCITIVVPVAMGLGYLVGRIKQRAEDPKLSAVANLVGFKNYGNSCWLTSAMQVLLASRYFEEIVRQPLVQWKDINVFDRDEHGNVRRGWITRDETEGEFGTRQEIQKALIEFLDEFKSQNRKRMQGAMVDFHKRMLQIVENGEFAQGRPQFYEIGKMGFSSELFEIIENVFGEDFRFFPNDLFLHESEDSFSEAAISPKMLFIPFNESKKGFSLDTTYDLSQHLVEGEFRLVGIRRKYSKNHATALVLKSGKWFHCNDGSVTKYQSKSIDVKAGDILILEKEVDEKA